MISILIPVKNAAPFLPGCVSSVLRQTAKDWEAVFVDDHSEDGSLELLHRLAAKDLRLRVFQSDGHGIIPALQTALAQACGKLITRMDADDLMPAYKLEVLRRRLIEAGPGHVATGKVLYFSDLPIRDGYLRYQNWLNRLVDEQSHYTEIYRECVLPSAGIMLFRKDLEAAGGFDNAQLPEDYDLAFRLYTLDIQVVKVPAIIHLWRDHPARTSRNDPAYSGRYFDLKMQYFLRKELDPQKQTLLIGAGKKGKYLARLLLQNGVDFIWLTNNRKKTGVAIYDQSLQYEPEYIFRKDKSQIISSIASPEEVAALERRFQKAGLKKGVDFFPFC